MTTDTLLIPAGAWSGKIYSTVIKDLVSLKPVLEVPSSAEIRSGASS
jgi:hypothetical protein